MTIEEPPSSSNKGLIIGLSVAVGILVAGLLVVLGVFLLGDDDTPTPTPTRPPVAEGPTAPPADIPDTPTTDNPGGYTDEEYIEAIEQALQIDFNDDELIALGKEICGVLDEYGVDAYVESLGDIADGLGITVDQLVTITEAAIIVYCPQHY